jgi:hypothetical protein
MKDKIWNYLWPKAIVVGKVLLALLAIYWLIGMLTGNPDGGHEMPE